MRTISTPERKTAIMSSSSANINPTINAIPIGVSLDHPLGDLDELINRVRTLIQTTAPNGISRDDGIDRVLAGSTYDPIVPIFFRCTWPYGSQTRHKLIWMKPSIPEEDFGSEITKNFKFNETGGAVRQMPATFVGCSPFTSGERHYVEARKRLNCEFDKEISPTNQQHIKMLAYTMSGFFELFVEPLQDRAKCFLCRQPCLLRSENRDHISVLVMGQVITCKECTENHEAVEIQRLGRKWSLAVMYSLAQQHVLASSLKYTLNLGTAEYDSL